ncbi:MAG TPA: putative peptidoglycan glycosyltransferase FtsW, partial [Nitrospirota bacterium]
WKADYRKLKYATPPLLILIFLLLIGALLGPERNGARRWIAFGGFGFQPSELAKPVLLMFLAASLAKRGAKLGDFATGVFPYLVISGTFALLIVFEPDLGTAALVGAVTIMMLYAAGARVKHLAMLGLAVLPVLYYELFHVGFRAKRLMAFIDPWQDPLGTGFQTIQSFLAFGGGGLTGLGLGESRQKLLFLPEPHNDFIFSVIGEELGFIGAIAVMMLFVVFVFIGFRLAVRCNDGMGRLLAFGLTGMIGLQALINMGVATGLFPNKGMPLPFISYGGSSVFVMLASVGLLLSVARLNRASIRQEDEGLEQALESR